jgi:hypothetical protein
MIDGRQKIPPLFTGKNVLRLEYRIVRHKGIKAKFHKDLFAYDLFDSGTYRTLQGLFLEGYRKIEKAGRKVFMDTTAPMTPARFEKLQAFAWRQENPDAYKAALQAMKESGALNKKALVRIRAMDRRQNFTIADTSPLIAELDTAVFNSISCC